ncbi:hypothetical protein OS175_05520 [Marinicella sp. S1101]|uniref:hypothetical protein n=1 Tax=Marinicella marina TaxID=2996016 RepID=UPI0022610049|nr:hypothetical protein [Marinicella marina]MCX7553329.1 hypothetical protein [Marinicella marina]MDJ1139061.1 hypothetical protein [Marinicella marina]
MNQESHPTTCSTQLQRHQLVVIFVTMLLAFINQAAAQTAPKESPETIRCSIYLVATQQTETSHTESLHCQYSNGLSYQLQGLTQAFLQQQQKVSQLIDEALIHNVIQITGLKKHQTAQITTAKARLRQQLKTSAQPQLSISQFQQTSDQIILSPQSQWSLFFDAAEFDANISALTVADESTLLAAGGGINERTALMIHVTANDFSTTDTPAALADSVFGTAGDEVNMTSQFDNCSYGQLQMMPAQGQNITNGVVELTINIDVEGESRGTVRNAVVAAGNQLFGSLYAQADHIMFALPPNTEGGWIAYASINGASSTYNNRWATYVSAQMHELGHNFGMGHSGIGSNEYADRSGMMGYSYSSDDGPRMCFNAVKSSKFGWYENKELTFYESDWRIGQDTWRGQITGIADYDQATANQHNLIKVHSIDGDQSSSSIHINFNRDAGINSGTRDGQDRLMVTSTNSPTGYNTSLVAANLASGESQTFNAFWSNNKDLIITVLDITTDTNGVMYADVELRVDFNQDDVIFNNGFD